MKNAVIYHKGRYKLFSPFIAKSIGYKIEFQGTTESCKLWITNKEKYLQLSEK